MTSHEKATKSVNTLLVNVRSNVREGRTKLPYANEDFLDYLENYCRAAWYRGYEAGLRAAKRKAGGAR